MTAALLESTIRSLPLIAKGKVRDNYAVGADRLLMVATDRLSAFDVVMGEPIPGKGEMLTRMALFWFGKLGHIVPNHLTGEDPESVVAPEEREQVRGRSMLVKRLKPLPVEAVVRGYLAGSGWKEYQEGQAVCGVALPAGLKNASKLPAPIFTPATKAEMGSHDENISFDRMKEIVGATFWPRRCERRPSSLSRGGGFRLAARDHHRGHQVRVWSGRGRNTDPDGRDPDPGFIKVLAR